MWPMHKPDPRLAIAVWHKHVDACYTCTDAYTQQDGWCVSRGCATGQRLFRDIGAKQGG